MINISKIQQQKPIAELLEFCIINVNKPSRTTSFGVVEKIKNIFSGRKTGHFGTLDLKVTGVLPIAINRACKLCEYFMHHDKEYIGKMYLHSDISEEELKEQMKKFVGRIMQKPPVKSAVKRVLRPRTVNKFEIIEKKGKVVSFHSDVEAGTYIRKLISDLGENIGGAHMVELIRIRAGIFKKENSFTIEEIQKAFDLWKENNDESKLREILIPAEIISEILPVVQIKKDNIEQILTGKPLIKKDLVDELPNSERFAVFLEDRFIEVARKVKEGDVVARAEFVLN